MAAGGAVTLARRDVPRLTGWHRSVHYAALITSLSTNLDEPESRASKDELCPRVGGVWVMSASPIPMPTQGEFSGFKTREPVRTSKGSNRATLSFPD